MQAHDTAPSQTPVHGVPQGGSALNTALSSATLLCKKVVQVIATCTCWCNCFCAICISPNLMHAVKHLHPMRNNDNTFSISCNIPCNNSASHCCIVFVVDLSLKSQSMPSIKSFCTCRLGGVLFPYSFPPTLLRSWMPTLLVTTLSASSAARTSMSKSSGRCT